MGSVLVLTLFGGTLVGERTLPHPPQPPAEHLLVIDLRGQPVEVKRAVLSLQGVVNRQQPQVYVLNSPWDEEWLRWLQAKGYTGEERRIAGPQELLAQFRSAIRGTVVPDPQVPATVNVAAMLAGLERAVIASPALQERWGLPVVHDLRGRWRRNVDAYRWAWDTLGPRLNLHLLAHEYPDSDHPFALDYEVAFGAFLFWTSGERDPPHPAADPAAERQFTERVLAGAPPNGAVLGWWAYGDPPRGLTEYEGVALASAYGKYTLGTEFCTNLTVHSAVRVPSEALGCPPSEGTETTLDRHKVYLSLNVVDSGDALWYWQWRQREVWEDPARGQVPIGWSLTPLLAEAMPAVLQWYVEQATPQDEFFAAGSGLSYVITPHFATRCAHPEAVWGEFLRRTGTAMQRLGLSLLALHNGGWNEPPHPEVLRRYVRGLPGLKGILADLGRHEGMTYERANYRLEGVPVFHCLTRWRPWASPSEVAERSRETAVSWLQREIQAATPVQRPAFLHVMALSWTDTPSVLQQVVQRLGKEYVPVTPSTLARLYLEASE